MAKRKFKDKLALQRKIGQAHLLPNMTLFKLEEIFSDNPEYETSQMASKTKVIRVKSNAFIDNRVWQKISKEVNK